MNEVTVMQIDALRSITWRINALREKINERVQNSTLSQEDVPLLVAEADLLLAAANTMKETVGTMESYEQFLDPLNTDSNDEPSQDGG